MICALVEQGKRVGVTATSHKVIRNLLDNIATMSATEGIATRLAQKIGETEEEPNGNSAVTEVKNNGEAETAPRWRGQCPWWNRLALGDRGLCSGRRCFVC